MLAVRQTISNDISQLDQVGRISDKGFVGFLSGTSSFVRAGPTAPGAITQAIVRIIKELMDAMGSAFKFDPAITLIDMTFHPIMHAQPYTGLTWNPLMALTVDVPSILLDGIAIALHQYILAAMHEEYYGSKSLRYELYQFNLAPELIRALE